MRRRTSDNKVYLATVLRTSAQIPRRGTSDTLVTLCDIDLVICLIHSSIGGEI
jgi:hypothetical protein